MLQIAPFVSLIGFVHVLPPSSDLLKPKLVAAYTLFAFLGSQAILFIKTHATESLLLTDGIVEFKSVKVFPSVDLYIPLPIKAVLPLAVPLQYDNPSPVPTYIEPSIA